MSRIYLVDESFRVRLMDAVAAVNLAELEQQRLLARMKDDLTAEAELAHLRACERTAEVTCQLAELKAEAVAAGNLVVAIELND